MGKNQTDLTRTILGALFILSLIGVSLWILRPFLAAIIWAAMIVLATWPLMIRVQGWLWGRRGLAVTVMSLILLCLLVAPLMAAIGLIVSNADLLIRLGQILGPIRNHNDSEMDNPDTAHRRPDHRDLE